MPWDVACEVEDAYRACEVRMAAEVEDAYKAAFRAYVCACACACRRLGLRFGVCHLIPCLVQTHILRWVVPDFVRPSLLPCLPPSLYRSVFVENKRSKVVSSIRQNVRAVSLSLGVYLCVCVCVCVATCAREYGICIHDLISVWPHNISQRRQHRVRPIRRACVHMCVPC